MQRTLYLFSFVDWMNLVTHCWICNQGINPLDFVLVHDLYYLSDWSRNLSELQKTLLWGVWGTIFPVTNELCFTCQCKIMFIPTSFENYLKIKLWNGVCEAGTPKQFSFTLLLPFSSAERSVGWGCCSIHSAQYILKDSSWHKVSVVQPGKTKDEGVL